MSSRLEAMRAKLAEQKQKQENGGGNAVARREYAHWNIDIGQSVTLRFVPDADPNDFFWKKKLTYDWKYPSATEPGQSVRVIMPCRNMYDGYTGDKACPVRKKLSAMFDAKGAEEEAARPYWVKTSYLYAGFVRRSSYNEPAVPENPIRIFDLNKKLHEFIEGSILVDDPERQLPADPVDYENGINFIIEKKRNGDFANYLPSWSQKVTSLTDEEQAALKQYGLVSLKGELPTKPSDEAFAIQMSMLEAALAGEPWNPEWETHFKPFKVKKAEGGSFSAGSKPKLDTPPENDDGDTPAPQLSTKAQDVMARLRGLNAAKTGAAAE